MGGEYYSSSKTWIFPSGAKIILRGLEAVDDVYQYKGVQVNHIGFDEVTSFDEFQYTYLFSRIRSTNNIRGRVFATTNPQSDGWVKDWIKDIWLDEDGYVKEEMNGKVMWYIRIGGEPHWYHSKEAAIKGGVEEHGLEPDEVLPTSFEFVRSSLSDNPSLGVDYKSKLLSMPEKDRMELLSGCWNYDASTGIYFKKDWVDQVSFHQLPRMKKIVRAWDIASTPPNQTNKNPDWTVGLKMGLGEDGYYYILDMVRFRDSIGNVKKVMRQTAVKDGEKVHISVPLDPGGHGKHAYEDHVRNLSGFVVKKAKTEKSKLERFLPFASLAENGLLKIVAQGWNKDFFKELEGFVGDGKRKDDIVDTCSDSLKLLNMGSVAPTNISIDSTSMFSANTWNL